MNINELKNEDLQRKNIILFLAYALAAGLGLLVQIIIQQADSCHYFNWNSFCYIRYYVYYCSESRYIAQNISVFCHTSWSDYSR